jgi:hypothetical protein
MKMRIQLIIEDESGRTTTAEIAAIERRQSDDLIGISLEEAKAYLWHGRPASSIAHARRPELGHRNRLGTRGSPVGETRRVHELHHDQRGGDPELRRSSPARRTHRDWIR